MQVELLAKKEKKMKEREREIEKKSKVVGKKLQTLDNFYPQYSVTLIVKYDVTTKYICDISFSQDVPAEWYNFTSQKILNDIKENESKGDFIGVISRKANDAEKQMSGMFKSYFDRIKRATAAGRPPNTDDTFKCHRFEISKMPVNHLPSSEVMSQVSHMWRSDHARFWYHNSNPFQSFNSIAISDTGKVSSEYVHTYLL